MTPADDGLDPTTELALRARAAGIFSRPGHQRPFRASAALFARQPVVHAEIPAREDADGVLPELGFVSGDDRLHLRQLARLGAAGERVLTVGALLAAAAVVNDQLSLLASGLPVS